MTAGVPRVVILVATSGRRARSRPRIVIIGGIVVISTAAALGVRCLKEFIGNYEFEKKWGYFTGPNNRARSP